MPGVRRGALARADRPRPGGRRRGGCSPCLSRCSRPSGCKSSRRRAAIDAATWWPERDAPAEATCRSSTLIGLVHSFGPFLLDVGERRLLRDGCVVPLVGKAIDTLRLLSRGPASSRRSRRSSSSLAGRHRQAQQPAVRRLARAADSRGRRRRQIQDRARPGYRLVASVGRAAPAPPSRAAGAGQRMHFASAHDGVQLPRMPSSGIGPPVVKAATGSATWTSTGEVPSGPTGSSCSSRGNTSFDMMHAETVCPTRQPSSITSRTSSPMLAPSSTPRAWSEPPLGISQGAAVTAAFAARNPDTSRPDPRGWMRARWRVKRSPALHQQFEAPDGGTCAKVGRKKHRVPPDLHDSILSVSPKERIELSTSCSGRPPRQTTPPRCYRPSATWMSATSSMSEPRHSYCTRDDAVVPMKDGIELASGIAAPLRPARQSQSRLVRPTSRRGPVLPKSSSGFCTKSGARGFPGKPHGNLRQAKGPGAPADLAFGPCRHRPR